MIVAEKFIRSLVSKYGKHTVYTDNGGTWYDKPCNIIGLKHYLHSPSLFNNLFAIDYIVF